MKKYNGDNETFKSFKHNDDDYKILLARRFTAKLLTRFFVMEKYDFDLLTLY